MSLVSGIALTLQVGVNGQLKHHVKSFELVCVISTFGSFLTFTLIMLYQLMNGMKSFPTFEMIRTTPWWLYWGGFIGAIYVFSTILSASRIGYANMFSLVICSQIVCAVTFDHFGLFAHEPNPISITKGIAVAVLIASVYVIQNY